MLRNACWPIALLVYVVASARRRSLIRSRAICIFSEALYYAHQGHYFEALARLDAELAQHHGLDEPQLDSLYPFIGSAEFSVGDFELNYRMHLRAGRAITAVLEGDVDESIRNEAAFRLARIHFQKGQLDDALQACDGSRAGAREPSVTTSSSCARTSTCSTAHPDDAAPC